LKSEKLLSFITSDFVTKFKSENHSGEGLVKQMEEIEVKEALATSIILNNITLAAHEKVKGFKISFDLMEKLKKKNMTRKHPLMLGTG
jgi:hypothetical protein